MTVSGWISVRVNTSQNHSAFVISTWIREEENQAIIRGRVFYEIPQLFNFCSHRNYARFVFWIADDSNELGNIYCARRLREDGAIQGRGSRVLPADPPIWSATE